MGKTMESFSLHHLKTSTDHEMRRTRDIIDALDAPISDECTQCRNLLKSAQKEAFYAIMEHVNSSKPGALFVDRPGGTGKTFLYNALYAEVRLVGQIVLSTATSGIDASNIPSGITTHSRFRIPLVTDISLACDVPRQSSLAALIRAGNLLIWDEASMAKRQNVIFTSQGSCDPNQLFEGKVVVFGGDFRQTMPVLPCKSQKEVVEGSMVSSHIWPKLIKFRLSENIRAKCDPEFAKILLALRNGELQSKESEFVALPKGIVRASSGDDKDPIGDLCSVIFTELAHHTFDPVIFTTRALLTPLNDNVDAINNVLIEKFPGKDVIYKSQDSMLDDNCAIYLAKFINKLNPGWMIPDELILKENCPVILLRDLQPSFGLCNGTRLICKRTALTATSVTARYRNNGSPGFGFDSSGGLLR
ncbi:uncharacterized protein LOC141627853 [Silene latifolia]|uniref:uncharacterized protein LOC141627853 n=1 Tax=Silene latifolia TaxID=37657 RepID=UPI003D77F521